MPDSSADCNPLDPLADEFVARFRAGERPSLTEYAERHPELADDIRELFPALVEMEQLKPVSADCTGAFVADADVIAPDRIGEFRILRQVGRGGMGVVYEAMQESLGRHVALKVLPAEALIDPKLRERFRRETRAAARLHHTNIVPVFGTGEADGRHFYAMQFIAGHPLDAVIDEVRRLRDKSGVAGRAVDVAQSLLTGTFSANGDRAPASQERERPEFAVRTPVAHAPGSPVSSGSMSDGGRSYWAAVARIGAQVADALAYAHGQGILHRDIKPSNLLLDHRGTVWVTDFGLAKADDAENLTQSGDVVGTVRYMAPERFRGDCDARADVYALGLTLYELLTLRPAFDTSNRLQQIDQIAHRNPPRPRARDPRIPHDLETIVMKAIDKDPARRYPSASDVADDLRRFLADEPITARRVGPAERLARWARRNPLVATLTAAIVLVTAGGFAATAAQARAAQDERDTAHEQRDDAQQQRDEVRAVNEQLRSTQAQLRGTLYAAHMNLAHSAWDAGLIARVNELLANHRPKPGESDLRGFEWHYFNRLCHSELLTLKGHPLGVRSLAYSPDGKRLASGSIAWDGAKNAFVAAEVKVWDVRTGQELLTINDGGWSVAYSPDGKRLASGSGTWDAVKEMWVAGEVKVRDGQTGQELLSLQGYTSVVTSVEFSPDGKRLASASRDKAVLWDVQTGQEILSIKVNDISRVAFSPDGQRVATATYNEGTVKLWDAKTGQELFTLKDGGRTVAFSFDGKRLVSGGKVWDAATGQKLLSVKGYEQSAAFSPDGKRLACAGRDEKGVKVRDAQTGTELLTFMGHTDSVTSVVYSPDGTRLASGSRDGAVKIWDATARPEPRTFSGQSNRVSSVSFSPDGRRLAFGSTGPRDAITNAYVAEVKVADARTGQELISLKGHTNQVWSVAFSPDGERLASASSDQTVKVWDVQTGRELLTFKGHAGKVVSVAFSPDGMRLASSISDPTGIGDKAYPGETGEVKVWDARSGQEVLSLKGHSRFVNSVTFSPDGKRLATLSRDQSVKVWDAQTGQEIRSLKVLVAIGGSVAFSPDGRRLASSNQRSGSWESAEVKVWDAQSGEELLTLKGQGFQGVG